MDGNERLWRALVLSAGRLAQSGMTFPRVVIPLVFSLSMRNVAASLDEGTRDLAADAAARPGNESNLQVRSIIEPGS